MLDVKFLSLVVDALLMIGDGVIAVALLYILVNVG
jgi:hypothetical protein